MPIPDYQTLMLPTLRIFADGQEHAARQVVEVLVKEFEISDQEREERLPSGKQRVIDNRAGWARTYMKNAGLLEVMRRGVYRITSRGKDVLKKKPERIDVVFLSQFPEFQEFRALRHANDETNDLPLAPATSLTLEETLENAFQEIQSRLASEILSVLKSCSPGFFERVVVEVLVNMGYGGSLQDAGRAIGKSGDGGIDGIIKEDRLGLDVIYLQAKRWDTVVGRPEIQKFVGALTGQRARKGVFITTSSFTKDALDYVSRIEMKIVLIDGETLAQMMIEHNVGVSTVSQYTLKRIDSDYFSEE